MIDKLKKMGPWWLLVVAASFGGCFETCNPPSGPGTGGTGTGGGAANALVTMNLTDYIAQGGTRVTTTAQCDALSSGLAVSKNSLSVDTMSGADGSFRVSCPLTVPNNRTYVFEITDGGTLYRCSGTIGGNRTISVDTRQGMPANCPAM